MRTYTRFVPGLDPDEVAELVAFCHQYPMKKRKANALLGLQAVRSGEGGKGSTVSDPTYSAAEKRVRFLRDVDLIDRTASRVDKGRWTRALIKNCCYRVPISELQPEDIPTYNRNAYIRAKQEFFQLLYIARGEIDTHGATEP